MGKDFKKTEDLIPKTNDIYNQLRSQIIEEGSVDEKTLEMMILCYAIADKSENCINDYMKLAEFVINGSVGGASIVAAFAELNSACNKADLAYSYI